MAALPMSLGCLLGGILMERYGRKMSQLILCVPFVLGWILIAVANNIDFILVGRLLTGFSVGMLGPPASVFIGETSEPKYRGFLLAAVSLAIAVGILISHILGTFLHWKLTAVICSVCPLMSYLLLTFVPESPSWLLSKGYVQLAEKSFKWLRGSDQESVNEFNEMLAKQNLTTDQNNYSVKNLKENATKPGFYKPLFIILIFFTIMQFSGVNAVAFYSVQIMKDTIGDGVNEYLAMLIIDGVRLMMSFTACILLRRYGRRELAVFSGIGTTVSLIGLSVFRYLAAYNSTVNEMFWLPLIFLIGYICFISVGIVPLPWCMNGEIFPLALRGLGSGISAAWNFFTFFIVVKTGPFLFAEIGSEGTFMVYGCVALMGTFYLYFFLPETKNKTLLEIEEEFSENKSKKLSESSA